MPKSYFKTFQKILLLSKEKNRPLGEVLKLGITLPLTKDEMRFAKNLRYLSTNLPKHFKKRKRIYLNLIEKLDLPELIVNQYVSYMDQIHPEDRFKYIDKLKSMTLKELTSHIGELYINPVTECENDLVLEFGDCLEQRTHEDLYEFKTNPKSMMLITMAFLKKIRTLTDRKEVYQKYTSLNVEELKSMEIPISQIKSMILVGLMNFIVAQDEHVQHAIINNLFDVNCPFL